ncbi:hypothetical protein FUSO7_13545 [Fusobacterium necrophorum BFTR-2]|nr:hypothetical protein FUSO7_13545 [Fusobacterium necrophorum BFTR-2]
MRKKRINKQSRILLSFYRAMKTYSKISKNIAKGDPLYSSIVHKAKISFLKTRKYKFSKNPLKRKIYTSKRTQLNKAEKKYWNLLL